MNLAFFGEENRAPSGNVRQAIGYGKVPYISVYYQRR